MQDPKEDEFGEFYGHYAGHFKSWGRDILERDPYDVVDEVYDEATERRWAEWKVDLITHTFNYPTFFELDRDIVHPATFELAAKHGMPLEPVTVEDIIHDLGDLARFRVGRQVKTEPLLDQLIDRGAPGILAFGRLVAAERALGDKVVTEYYFDGYDPVLRFREKLQAFSSDLPVDLGVGKTFDELVIPLALELAREQLERFRELTDLEGGDWLMFLRNFVFQLVGACRPYMSDAEKELMLTVPSYYTPSQQADALIAVAEGLMPDGVEESESATLVRILQDLRRHPQYHELLLEQARELSAAANLSFGEDVRGQVRQLTELIPEPAYRFTSEPQSVRRRFDDLQRLRQDDPDSQEQFLMLADIFVRLDQAENYEELIQHVRQFGADVRPVLEEIVETIGDRDQRRATIRQAARDLLQEEDT